MFVRTGVSASGELGCSLPLCGGLGWCGEIRVAPPVEESDTPTPPKVPPKPRSPRFHRLVCEEPTRWLERLRSGEIAENEMHNGLMTCAACGRWLAEDAAWKGSGERYSSSVRMPKRRNRHRASPPVRPNRGGRQNFFAQNKSPPRPPPAHWDIEQELRPSKLGDAPAIEYLGDLRHVRYRKHAP